jgi:transposase
MDERLRFVELLLNGDAMTDVCREFGISGMIGYKIFDRFKEHGFEALTDRCRRPIRYANQPPPQIESLILTFKREKPHWVLARSASSWSGDFPETSEFPPRVRSTPFCTGIAWSRP